MCIQAEHTFIHASTLNEGKYFQAHHYRKKISYLHQCKYCTLFFVPIFNIKSLKRLEIYWLYSNRKIKTGAGLFKMKIL